MCEFKRSESDEEYVMVKSPNLNIHHSFYQYHINGIVNEAELGKRTMEKEKDCKGDWQKAVFGSIALIELNKEKLCHLEIYKIIDIKNLKFILENSKLYMDKVCSWEDPYENFLFKSEHSTPEFKFKADSIIPYIFGQSWSLKEESDAMWRIYSQSGRYNDFIKNKSGWNDDMSCYAGIRIKVNAHKLLEACYVEDASMASLWMGNVLYTSIDQIQCELQNSINSGSRIEQVFGESYFYKRPEFAHENEFRIIYNFSTEEINNAQKNAKRISFPIVASDLIEEFVLDPRLDDKSEEFMRGLLIEMGADKTRIRKSDLYSFNSLSLLWK